MIIIVIITAAFLILYLTSFIRQVRQKKENEINTVEEFHNNYGINHNKEAFPQNRNTRESGSAYKYITKYNSSEDYSEKR